MVNGSTLFFSFWPGWPRTHRDFSSTEIKDMCSTTDWFLILQRGRNPGSQHCNQLWICTKNFLIQHKTLCSHLYCVIYRSFQTEARCSEFWFDCSSLWTQEMQGLPGRSRSIDWVTFPSYQALLCGLLVTCPEDPLRYLEKMIITIIQSGLENLLW